jgi:predicted transposase/invertase (TIGR01784 family)
MNEITMSDSRPKIKATADTFVHYLFATPGNEHILLSFVNAVQEDAGQPPVKETQVLNPFNPKTFITDKRSIIDIKAVAKNNRSFVIEFQVALHEAFLNRTLYYWARAYIAQMRQGDDYDKLLPVVVIIVACFLLHENLEKLHNTFWIMSQDVPGLVLTEDLQFHIMELVKEKIDQLQNMNSPLGRWLGFFYHADKKDEAEMRVLLKNDDTAVEEAYDAFLRFNQDEEMRQLDEARQQYLHDYNTEIKYAEKKGKIEGEIKSILRTLTKRFHRVPQQIEEKILAIDNLDHLEQLADLAFDCTTMEEFGKIVK